MKPIFTPHAGEFLVGEMIEQEYGLNVWLPSKDVGTDLLVTDPGNSRTCSLQVKLSRDYADRYKMPSLGIGDITASGWFQFSRAKIESSPADYWVLLIVSAKKSGEKIRTHHVVIPPERLLKKLVKTYGDVSTFKFYLAVTDTEKVYDWRGPKGQNGDLKKGLSRSNPRNYSDYLENWACLDKLR